MDISFDRFVICIYLHQLFIISQNDSSRQWNQWDANVDNESIHQRCFPIPKIGSQTKNEKNRMINRAWTGLIDICKQTNKKTRWKSSNWNAVIRKYNHLNLCYSVVWLIQGYELILWHTRILLRNNQLDRCRWIRMMPMKWIYFEMIIEMFFVASFFHVWIN